MYIYLYIKRNKIRKICTHRELYHTSCFSFFEHFLSIRIVNRLRQILKRTTAVTKNIIIITIITDLLHLNDISVIVFYLVSLLVFNKISLYLRLISVFVFKCIETKKLCWLGQFLKYRYLIFLCRLRSILIDFYRFQFRLRLFPLSRYV